MIKLAISREADDFRAEFTKWLKNNPPPEPRNSSLDEFVRVGREWQGALARGKWVGVHWPKEYGGRGLSLVEEAIVHEELVRASAPQLLGLFGLTMVGPVLIKHGTGDQRKKYLSKILSGEEIWCQGFSEPGAGSDLAAVRCRAREEKDGFYVTGQKVWTSFAHIADYCFILCRTSDTGGKHEGLSYLLLDMKAEGVSTAPLKQISGDMEFNEVFFDEVFVPGENLVGKTGEGWKIAISTLMFERVVLTFARQLQSETALIELIESSKELDDPCLKREIEGEIAKACAVKALTYEHLLEYAEGKAPGPEGSLDKLLWSESFQSAVKLALKARGALAALGESSPENNLLAHRYLYSRGRTIAAGTSEIQRDIIAERLLELPRIRAR